MHESLTSQIRSARPPKVLRKAGESMGWVREQEPDSQGGLVSSRTYFLVGSECRFSCSMCDLWKYTLIEGRTPVGSLSAQIEEISHRISQESSVATGGEWLKLYNASNFFDPANVDPQEYESIAKQCEGFDRVVVENHAALLSSNKTQELVRRFRDMLSGDLEVAMGLETIDPLGMKWLNKAMTLEDFEHAVRFLGGEGIYVRAFVLLQPLGTPCEESVEWAVRSCQQATRWGAHRVSLIPTRAGNGFVETVATKIGWMPPTVADLERAFETLLRDRPENPSQGSSASIYTVDLWDWESIAGTCLICSRDRCERLQQMNYTQRLSETMIHGCRCGNNMQSS